jgi:hypothetical protein
MKTKAKLLYPSSLLSLIILAPAAVRAAWAAPLNDKIEKLFEQIQDLESMRRNTEECYQAETRSTQSASWSGQSWAYHAELNGKLMNRVFGHLAGTPEYESFFSEHRTLIQKPDHSRTHTDELFAEYMRQLESGRTRFLTQWKEWGHGINSKEIR